MDWQALERQIQKLRAQCNEIDRLIAFFENFPPAAGFPAPPAR